MTRRSHRNFSISTADRIKAAHGPPAFVRRKRHIEDLEAALLETATEAIRTTGSVEAARQALKGSPAVDKPLRELNRLIEAHNRYYPIEANLPLDPATGAQLDRGVGVRKPWTPLPRVTLDDVLGAACGASSSVGKSTRGPMPLPLKVVHDSDPIIPQKPPVSASSLAHRDLRRGAWWQAIPAYRTVDEATFLDHAWQAKFSITRVSKLVETIQELVPSGFVEDLENGMKRAPMSVRVSPYIVSLIDWEHPYEDPLRTQFFPLASRLLPDHPKLGLDSLHEQKDAPVPGLTHRYPDKALFLPLDTCPVYCRFCTRSYAIGLDTNEVEKVHLRPNEDRWRRAYDYIASRPELEDIVVSGGDAYQLRASHIAEIGEELLSIPNVRRMRFATKGPAVMPMKILTDDAWLDALTRVVEKGRRLRKDVVLHTHFNNPNEITGITEEAMGRLFERGIVVRNQSVLIRGVNDSVDTMMLLVKRLGHLNVHPYYVYVHDMVRGVEDLRTSVDTAVHIEKHVRGATAGYNTPTFVVDAPGGGGKRDAHSHEYYDRDTGISVYAAPSVKPGQLFIYLDPLHQLAAHQQRRWQDPAEQRAMIDDAMSKARGRAR